MQALSTAVRCLWFILLCLFTAGVSAQSTSQPLGSALNSDGSLNLSAAGNFDPSGYRMVSGPNGEPRFITEPQAVGAGCVDQWDTTFVPNGANGEVNAIASDGSGNIYFAGNFTSIQGIPLTRIAKWNGTAWSGLGTGVNGVINTVAVSGTDVYVGGGFSQAGGNNAKNVAKWNGSTWSALGAGLGGGTHVVEAIAILGSDVYIGGNFNTGDGSPANGLVRWDGVAYSAAGVSGQVYALEVNAGHLYVGGFVGLIADATVAGLLKWDGFSWTGFGLSNTSTVSAIGFNGTDIYVGGDIRRPSVGTQHIAKWNGSTWTSLGFFQNSPAVNAFAFLGTDVYAAGSFERSGGIGIGNGVLKYNGSQWSAIGTGTEFGTVNDLYVSGNTFIVAGDFEQAGGIGARNLATVTDGTSWAQAFPGTGPDNTVRAIAVSGTNVYIGGTFRSVGAVAAHKIAKWDTVTNTWSAVGTGLSDFTSEHSNISAIAVVGDKVYAGGSFSSIGGVFTSNIAVWNGTAWSAMGTGIAGTVAAIIAKGDDVYVAGNFTTAGGVAAKSIAKWNGTAWSGLNSASLPTQIVSMAFMGNDIYVAIPTTTIANPMYFAKYDGTNWTGLGADLGDRGVSGVAVVGTDVYVAGGWVTIGSLTVNHVAKWNGSWSALGNGIPYSGVGIPGWRLAASGPDVIAFGPFSVATGAPANGIAKWNGTTWSAFGTGVSSASAVTSAGGDIFVGGGFTTAGCRQSAYLARWRETVWTGATNADWHTAANWGGGSIPPANAGITIQANNATISTADVSVGNLIIAGGRTVAVGSGRTLTVNGRLDLSDGFITGPGTLVVNGDLTITTGDVTNLASLTVNGSLTLNGGKIRGTGPVSLTDCRVGAVIGGNATSFITSPLTRCVNSSGTYRFPVGTGTTYAPVELSSISGSGDFTVEPKSGAYAGAAAGLPPNRLQRWWNLTNGGGVTQANLTFQYVDADVVGPEARYRVYRIDAGVATPITTTPNTTTNRATVTGVTSFSPWTLAEGTSTPLTMTGRVTNPNGRGVTNTLVSLDDGQGNLRYTMTNHSGYYRFMNVSTFRVYTVTAASKKYTVTNPVRIVDFDEFTTGVNFVTSDN